MHLRVSKMVLYAAHQQWFFTDNTHKLWGWENIDIATKWKHKERAKRKKEKKKKRKKIYEKWKMKRELI